MTLRWRYVNTFTALNLALTCTTVQAGERQDLTLLYQSAISFVKSEFSPPLAEYEIRIGRLEPSLFLQKCQHLTASFAPRSASTGRVLVNVQCESPVRWVASVPLTIFRAIPYVVTSRLLPKGTIVTGEDLILYSPPNGATPPADSLTNPEPLLGLQVIRTLGLGVAVSPSMFARPNIVRINQDVLVLIQGDGFAIEAPATAMSDAAEGEILQVRTKSGKKLQGKLRSDCRVIVTQP